VTDLAVAPGLDLDLQRERVTAVARSDRAHLETPPRHELCWEALILAREVAVAVAIRVQDVTVHDQPDAGLCLWPQDDQAVLGFRLVGWLLANGAVNLAQVGRVPRKVDREKHQRAPKIRAAHTFNLQSD